MLKLFKLTLLLALSSLLAACDTGGGAPVSAPNFKRYQPIYMKVSKIEVLEEYRSPNVAPNVEHMMSYSPADAMQIWVKQRLRAAGGPKTMQVIIKDASVVGQDVPGSDVMFGWGGTRQYDTRLEVELRVYGDAALSEASVGVVATRTLKLPASASVATRDQKFRAMIEEMMTTVNAEMEKNIFQHLGSYVNFSMNP